MFRLENLLSKSDENPSETSRIVRSPIKIEWNHFKKSRSHSPKNFYNFKLAKIPESSYEKMVKIQNKVNKLKAENSKLMSKLTPLNLNQTKNSFEAFSPKLTEVKPYITKIKLPQETVSYFNELKEIKTQEYLLSPDQESFEKHPLYAERFSKKPGKSLKTILTPKEESKENFAKLFHLNNLLKNCLENEYFKKAMIISKIMGILESNPELFIEVNGFFQANLQKFLFCREENIFLKYKKIVEGKEKEGNLVTYMKIVEELINAVDNINEKNTENLREKNREICELTNIREENLKKISNLESKLENLSKEIEAKHSKEKEILKKKVFSL